MSDPHPVVTILGRSDDVIGKELKRHGLGLSLSETRRLGGLLGRDPTRAEAFLFDVAWSEHCSYKSSRSTLQAFFGSAKLPPHVILGPGEDAGIVSFTTWKGRSYALVLSHESHNHPSQVLPVEGAATGIGGIVRDVYCMGADVIGVLDALRFGDPSVPACAEIARGVVEGIWRYGNALGVPNLGGDVYFDARYNDNCLVNVVALGIVPTDRIVRSRVPQAAIREPYVAILVGKPTDGSGFGGASFASADLGEGDDEQNLGAVQVADPFLKRVLAEANRAVLNELTNEGIEVGFKDLGAGGIGGATVEMAAAGNFGVEMYLDNVRTAEPDLPPEVILVGETQERFVWAVPERVSDRVIEIYERDYEMGQLHPGAGAVILGKFTDAERVVVRYHREIVVDCPAKDLTEGLAYERKAAAPESAVPAPAVPLPELDGESMLEAFYGMLQHPDGASRAYVYRHYDPEVQGRTVLRPGEADAGVIAPIPGCPAGVAISVDGNPHRGLEDPYQAGAWAVVEAARNVATVGAKPIAISDCLNFGNPEKPEVFWTFREAVRGIAETAAGLGLMDHPDQTLPVITGNVSLYNQSVGGQPIPPSPIVGCVGTLPDVRRAVDLAFKTPGSAILWAGRVNDAMGGTLFARVSDIDGGPYPRVDVRMERALISTLHRIIQEGRVSAAHDVSEGGLLMAVFEMLSPAGETTTLGAELDLAAVPQEASPVAVAFGEAGAMLLEVRPEHVDEVRDAFQTAGIPAGVIGHVTEERSLLIDWMGGGRSELDLDRAHTVWEEGLTRWLR